jgi:hypothetical protein
MKRLSLPVLVPLVLATFAACGSSSEGGGPSGSDAGDAAPAVDASSSDAGKHDATPPQDGGADAAADADGGLPPLCKTYPDNNIPYQGELASRWSVISFRAMELAGADCAIGAYFASPGASNPIQIDCYTEELRAVAQCVAKNGLITVYDQESRDGNNDRCLPAVRIGFKNASPSAKDVERFITLTKNAAVDIGMAPADAARLEALLLAKKSTAVVSASSDYTQSSCDGGI